MKSSHSSAEVEGTYHLLRNPDTTPDAIVDAGFIATAKMQHRRG